MMHDKHKKMRNFTFQYSEERADCVFDDKLKIACARDFNAQK